MSNRSTASWTRDHLRPTDGPNARKKMILERWQVGLLNAIDREKKSIFAIRAASQVGKTMLALAVGIRAASKGLGVLMASSTETGTRDLARRLEASVQASPELSQLFPSPRSGPGARASWKDRRLDGGGWIGMAAAGSADQLSARTAAVAVADEISRWAGRVRSGEGHPLTLLRMRLSDWGDLSRLVAISSPIRPRDAIGLLYNDGDRRRLEYRCPDCSEATWFDWALVSGREKNETPAIACIACGSRHEERARRAMLRTAVWKPQRINPTDPAIASFGLSRLDSKRASLRQVAGEFRRARLGVERGDPTALSTFRNLSLGLPSEVGSADVEKLYESRERTPDYSRLEQVCAGVDVQDSRLVWVVLAFDAGNMNVWLIDHGDVIGDPRDSEVWEVLAGGLAGPRAGRWVPSVVCVDAGFLTSDVQRQCARRSWFLPCVGRAGAGRPIARPLGPTGLATVGVDSAKDWWIGRLTADRVHFPMEITRAELVEVAASEALVAKNGALRWEKQGPNHRWDCAILAIHGRHFAPRTAAVSAPRRFLSIS